MKKKLIRVLLLAAAGVLLLVVLIVGSMLLFSRLSPEGYANWWAKTSDALLFNKTVEDFPGRLIDNLDDDPTTNFVVYAKDVTRVYVYGDRNQLVSADVEGKEYIIANPDEQITELKRGDVFFMEPSEQCVTGVSVKVKKVKVKGDQAIVTGTTPDMDELIEYADVDMDLPMKTAFVEEWDDPVTFGWGVLEDEQAVWDARSREEIHAQLAQLQAEGLGSAGAALAPGASGEAAGTADPQADVPFAPGDQLLSVGGAGTEAHNPDAGKVDEAGTVWFNLTTRLEYTHGPGHIRGDVGIRVSNMHVTFKYHPLLLTAQAGVEADVRPFVDGQLGLKISHQWVFRMPRIYMPVAGPLCVTLAANPVLTANGGIYAHFSFAATAHTGGSLNISPLAPGFPQGQFSGPQDVAARVEFQGMEGSLELSVLRVAVGFGVPEILEANLHGDAGVALTATQDNELGLLENGLYHDCDFCIDGDVDWFVRLQLSMLSIADKAIHLTPAGGGNGPAWTLFEHRGDFPQLEYMGFYISRRDDGEGEKITSGWGPCPYKGYPYTVKVVSSTGKEEISGENFVVTAVDDKNHPRQELTDEEGIARLMLPAGSYKLTVQHGLYTHTENISVKKSPSPANLHPIQGGTTPAAPEPDKVIEVEIEPEIFVVLYTPEAYMVNTAPLGQFLGQHPYTLIPLDYNPGYMGMIEQLMLAGAEPGDVVVNMLWDAGRTYSSRDEDADHWNFLLPICDIEIGRLVLDGCRFDPNTGEEAPGEYQVLWWVDSFSQFRQGGSFLHNEHWVNFYDPDVRDPAPHYHNVNHTKGAVVYTYENYPDEYPYDAAYVATDYQQPLSNYYEMTEDFGSRSYMSLYQQAEALNSCADDAAALYLNYVDLMYLYNDEFLSIAP